MRKAFGTLLSFLLLVVAAGSLAPLVTAQQINQAYNPKIYYASDYGQWQINGQTANTFQWSPGTLCFIAPVGTAQQFFAFNTNAPILVVDATPANNEVLTPSAVSQSPSFCNITVSPANQHYSFRVTSGTGGLQEVLNAIPAQTPYPAVVYLDRNWYALANAVPGTTPAAIIGAAAGNSAIRLVDITTTPFQYYAWNNTKYAVIGTATGGSSAPTAAAGAAAGTSPTGPTNTDVNGGNQFTVALTTGTATTTGTLFTETWATSSAFTFTPQCTVRSTGSNSFTAFTIATTYPSGTHALLTVTATAAPVASTAYTFAVSCQ